MNSNYFKVTINDVLFDCLTDLNIEYNKLWGEDTGRTYDEGEFMGTLVGIFPKLGIEFAPRTAQELSDLLTVCNTGRQVVQWYNPQFMKMVTAVFYSNDVKVSMKKALSGDYDRLPINFIATKKQVEDGE